MSVEATDRTGPKPDGAEAPGRATRRPSCAPSRRTRHRPRRAAVHGKGRRGRAAPVPDGSTMATEVEVAPGIHAHVLRCRPHPRLGDHPARASRDTRRRASVTIVFSGDLGRPGTPILRDPTVDDRRRLRPRRVDVRRARARTRGRGDPVLAETVRMVARCRRRAARPVVRDRANAGGRLGAGSADRARRDPAAAAVPRFADGLARRPTSTATTPSIYDEETDEAAATTATSPLDYPNQTITRDAQGIAGDRQGASAVHDRGLERDADRGPGRRPPAQPHRRPDSDHPVRRLPGRGHARCAPPGRRQDGQARRPGPAGPLPHQLDQRLLRARRRERAAGLARHFAAGPAAGRPGLPAHASSSSMATRRPRSRSSRRCRDSASRPTSRTGGNASRWTEGRRIRRDMLGRRPRVTQRPSATLARCDPA